MKDLIKVARKLESLGLMKEAAQLNHIIKTASHGDYETEYSNRIASLKERRDELETKIYKHKKSNSMDDSRYQQLMGELDNVRQQISELINYGL